MDLAEKKTALHIAIDASIAAGEKIWEVYNSDDFNVELKDDNSPLTIADTRSNDEIMKYLNDTDYPVLSEEGRSIAYDERKQWNHLWIVDPLDGTKEFIKRNGEFTVNIALIENGRPVLGVVYVPAKEAMYFGVDEWGSFYRETVSEIWKQDNLDDVINSCTKLPLIGKDNDTFTVVASRSHLSEETKEFIESLKEKYGDVEITSIGSSLKICLVAEGKADIYPRFAPTMEWDTAAGHAVAIGAGKEITDYETKSPMVYNRKELKNNWFIVQ